jgi:hypothetical protein
MADCKHTPDYQAALDAAYRTVDALGGTFDRSSEWDRGYDEAIRLALSAIGMLGGRDADLVRADMLNALREIADSHIPDQPAPHAGDDLAWAQQHVARLHFLARRVIARTTGAA